MHSMVWRAELAGHQDQRERLLREDDSKRKELDVMVLGIGREKLAVEMCGQSNAPWSVWIFRRDHVGDVFWAIWCRVHESILF